MEESTVRSEGSNSLVTGTTQGYISKWDLINTDNDDYIRQYDLVSCGVLMLWYITKLPSTKKKLLTLEDWDSTNKKATIHKCRQLYEAVLLSVVGDHLRMPHLLH